MCPMEPIRQIDGLCIEPKVGVSQLAERASCVQLSGPASPKT